MTESQLPTDDELNLFKKKNMTTIRSLSEQDMFIIPNGYILKTYKYTNIQFHSFPFPLIIKVQSNLHLPTRVLTILKLLFVCVTSHLMPFRT